MRIAHQSTVDIPNGPSISSSRSVEVEAFDLIEVELASGAADVEVEVQPGAAGQVKFLAVTSTRYGPEVSYKVNTAAATETHALDQPHVLAGDGAVAMLDASPELLFLSNAFTDGDVNVQILVGRDATP